MTVAAMSVGAGLTLLVLVFAAAFLVWAWACDRIDRRRAAKADRLWQDYAGRDLL